MIKEKGWAFFLIFGLVVIKFIKYDPYEDLQDMCNRRYRN